MPVTRWAAQHIGYEWSADGRTITPPVFDQAVREHAGEELVTYYGKPYRLDPADAQSVYDFFDSEIDRVGERVVTTWQYAPDPPSEGAIP